MNLIHFHLELEKSFQSGTRLEQDGKKSSPLYEVKQRGEGKNFNLALA